MILQTLAALINLGIAISISRTALSKPRRLAGRSLALLSVFTAIWSLCLLLLGTPALAPLSTYMIAAIYLSATLAASAQFFYVVWQSNREYWINRLPVALLAVIPLLTQILFWVEPWHGLLFGVAAPQTVNLLLFTGAWGKINAAYTFGLMCASIFLVWNTYLERPHSAFMPYGVVLVGCMIPSAAATIDFADIPPFAGTQLLPVGFTLAAMAYAYYFFQRRADIVASIDRNAVVEGMDDGWMVLDSQNSVVDMNPAAERMAGLARADVLGQPVSTMLGTLPNFGQTFNRSQELEMKRSMKSEDGWKYLNIRISPFFDRNRKPFGRLAFWHDVTERKQTEDARQRARDEMLVLLNAISSAASNQVDLDDFLSESIYHIIYPFRSQVVAFFLLDEKSENKDDQRFLLSAHLGLPAESATQLACVDASSPLFAAIARDQEPLQIEDVDADTAYPGRLERPGACLPAGDSA